MWSDRATLDFQFGVIGGADSVSFDVALAFLYDVDPGTRNPPEVFVSAFDFSSRTGSTLFPTLPDEFTIGEFGVGRGRHFTATAADFGLTRIDYLNIGSYDTGPPYEVGIDNLSINGATHPWERQAILLNSESAAAAAPFPKDQMITLPIEDASAVGVLQEVTGVVTITRPNGDLVPAVVGMPIYTDDVIETDGEGSANIMFVDDTNFAVSPNARLDIDEYVYDPGAESPENNFNFLRGVREFIRDAVGSDPEDPNNVPIGGFGIRGDATPYINWDPLNPAAEMRSSTA